MDPYSFNDLLIYEFNNDAKNYLKITLNYHLYNLHLCTHFIITIYAHLQDL